MSLRQIVVGDNESSDQLHGSKFVIEMSTPAPVDGFVLGWGLPKYFDARMNIGST